jgi:hypothetical protein
MLLHEPQIPSGSSKQLHTTSVAEGVPMELWEPGRTGDTSPSFFVEQIQAIFIAWSLVTSGPLRQAVRWHRVEHQVDPVIVVRA